MPEYARPRSRPLAPQGFTSKEFPVIRKLTEIILGEDLKNSTGELERGAVASIYEKSPNGLI
jgi:hypothetical protein